MAVIKYRKGQWSIIGKSKYIPLGPGGPGLSAATASVDGKTYTGAGVKPLSTVTVYVGGVQAGTAVADANGDWSYTFANAPAKNSVIGWDGIISAPTTIAPTPHPTLGGLNLSGATFTQGAAAGTVIGTFAGKTAGSTLSISPNDGTVAISGDQTKLVVGATASTPGTRSYTVTETDADATNGPKTTTFAITCNIALLNLNTRFVAEGDSITAGSNGPSWLWAFDAASAGRFFMPQGYNQATGGQTAAQMATQVAQITALSPKVVSLLAGTNDLGGTSDTPATIYGNLKTCWKAYIDGGAQHVIIATVMPRNDSVWTALTAARQTDRVTLNNLISGYATDPDLANYKDKLHLVNLESYNPATDSIEGLHPQWLGAIKVGKLFAAVANSLIDQTHTLNGDLYLDATNVLSSKNPALTGTTGTMSGTAQPTGAVATGWSVSENGGMTVVCSKSTLNGAEAQRIVVSGTNSTVQRLVNFSAAVNVTGNIGDSFEACIDFSLAAGHQKIRDIVINHATASTPNSGNQSFNFDGAGAISGTLRSAVTAPLSAAITTITLQALLNFDVGTVGADITWGKPYLRKVPATI
ncbi:SGNH/GDSL hydrolase family protein [Bradyrhizobium erythrophlei]|uniref:Lysophospholipase L1 n=1 Tax=Bradyrhizobium erythrophlei TaxID=1437360 RepID=A0A1M5PWN0_9BRAD|nr:GDSL-type esterase/lipase family protein [Bradyrhizobium erythrophlei]SHH05879.1 Lysophospholipase L1 [Bradyrhizobium erythrophlei]